MAAARVLPVQTCRSSHPSAAPTGTNTTGSYAKGWGVPVGSDTHIFHLQIRLQTIFSQLSPVPRSFVAAERGLGTKHVIAVHPETETGNEAPVASEPPHGRALWQQRDISAGHYRGVAAYLGRVSLFVSSQPTQLNQYWNFILISQETEPQEIDSTSHYRRTKHPGCHPHLLQKPDATSSQYREKPTRQRGTGAPKPPAGAGSWCGSAAFGRALGTASRTQRNIPCSSQRAQGPDHCWHTEPHSSCCRCQLWVSLPPSHSLLHRGSTEAQ